MKTVSEPSQRGVLDPGYTDEQVWALWLEHGKTRDVARITGYSQSHTRRRLMDIRLKLGLGPNDADPDRQEKFTRLVAAPPESIEGGGHLRKLGVTLYGVAAVDKISGHLTTTGLDATRAEYVFDKKTPQFPPIQPANPSIVKYQSPPRIMRKVLSYALISDMQIGHLHDVQNDTWENIHDDEAIDVAKQIVADLQPKKLIFIGDAADNTMLSHWRKIPDFQNTTQRSTQTAHDTLAAFKSAAGKQCSETIMIGSNHQNRYERFLQDHNLEMLGVKRATLKGQIPDGWPVFSEGFMLRYDELGIKFSGQYPGGEYWLIDGKLAIMHAPPKAGEFAASVMHGHTHKVTRSQRVFFQGKGAEGRNVVWDYDIGCLCRVDSTTNLMRMVITAVPSNRARTDWGQGIAVVNVIDGKDPRFVVHQIEIVRGFAEYAGQPYRAKVK